MLISQCCLKVVCHFFSFHITVKWHKTDKNFPLYQVRTRLYIAHTCTVHAVIPWLKGRRVCLYPQFWGKDSVWCSQRALQKQLEEVRWMLVPYSWLLSPFGLGILSCWYRLLVNYWYSWKRGQIEANEKFVNQYTSDSFIRMNFSPPHYRPEGYLVLDTVLVPSLIKTQLPAFYKVAL